MHVARLYSRNLGVCGGERMRNRRETEQVWLTEDVKITDGNTNINEELGRF